MTLLQDESGPRMENMSKDGIYVIWVEESLHEPMYFFICNLLLNGVFGNTVIFPQIFVHLLVGSSTISFSGCITQAYCVESYAAVEILTFTTMAYDRYLAVGNPLRYSSIMTNIKALKYIGGIWALILTLVLMALIMAAKLTFCGVNINNIYCEIKSIVRLACEDTPLNNTFGLVEKLVVLSICVMIIIYCYIATLVICLKTSGLNIGDISVTAHILLSIAGVFTSVTVNPIVYGLRTEALKLRLANNLQKMNNLCRAEMANCSAPYFEPKSSAFNSPWLQKLDAAEGVQP
ncbi:olfactory receptor 52E8-like [Dendropsophus ebraccatus]|uniref:olfactory receptor 52E8-like n=1 Tax=Dendropsophus ebraccatus TaxID=150705 RepID=UPI0038316842